MSRTSAATSVFAAVLLSSALTTAVVAQAGSGDGQDVTGIAENVGHRKHIRVSVSLRPDIEIRDPVVHGDVLEGVDWNTGHPVQFRTSEIESIAGQGSAALTGFLVGAALGGVTGAIGGAALSHLCVFGDCPQPTAGEQAGAALTGAMMGGMTVGLAGLMIAAPIRKWTTVYRAQQSAVHPVFRGTSIGLEVAF